MEKWFAPVWILDGAVIYLSPGLTVRVPSQELIDEQGERFPLSPTGTMICEACRSPIAIEQLIAIISSRFGQSDPAEIAAQITRFVGDLFLGGFVGIHQSFTKELASVVAGFPGLLMAAWIDRTLVKRGGRFPVRRYRPSPRNILRASLEAFQPLLVMGVVGAVALPAAAGSIGSLNRLAGSGLLQVSWAVAVFFASILMVAIVHELGHWYAGRRLGVRCRWVTARRGLVSVTFPATKSRDALVIAAAGPVSGVVMGLVAVGTLAILPPDWMILFGLDQLWLSMTLAAVVVTLMQVVSATPVTSDGRVIWQHLRHRRMAKDA